MHFVAVQEQWLGGWKSHKWKYLFSFSFFCFVFLFEESNLHILVYNLGVKKSLYCKYCEIGFKTHFKQLSALFLVQIHFRPFLPHKCISLNRLRLLWSFLFREMCQQKLTKHFMTENFRFLQNFTFKKFEFNNKWMKSQILWKNSIVSYLVDRNDFLQSLIVKGSHSLT